MTSIEILKQIDELIIITENELTFEFKKGSFSEIYVGFFEKVVELMENYEKVLEIEHFKQTEL